MNIHTASIFTPQYANDPHPLQKFYATFGEHVMPDMSPGAKYLVTFNGADLQGFRGHDDIGDSFTISATLFEPLAPDTAWVPPSAMIIPVDPPAGDVDYTHMGNYKGPKGHRFTTGGNYNLIYECGTVGVWQQVSGEYFDVTHDYSQGGGIPNKPSAHNAAHNPTASDILGGQTAAPAPDCDMTGIVVTKVEGCDAVFDDSVPWDDDDAPSIKHEPESTEALREYRFKPNLF